MTPKKYSNWVIWMRLVDQSKEGVRGDLRDRLLGIFREMEDVYFGSTLHKEILDGNSFYDT